MSTDRLRTIIMRLLMEREFYGYEISKELSLKGVRLRPNYAYMILKEMEKDDLLKSRWVKDKGSGPEKHLYSLSKHGQKEFRAKLKEALDLLMGAFIHHNLTEEDISDHAATIKTLFTSLGVPSPNVKGVNLVIAVPFYDPIICYPLYYYAASEAFPKASVYVVKPPELRLQAEKPNLTFLDGWRHDMPLKDGYADYLILNDLPKDIPMKKTIVECRRVLKHNGHLMIHLNPAMTEENRPTKLSFFNFVVNLYYGMYEQEQFISIQHVRSLLSTYFKEVRDLERLGRIFLYATGKKTVEEHVTIAPLTR